MDEYPINAGKPEKRNSQLIVLSAEELLQLEVPPRELLLSPWLPSQGLCMIHGWRGGGKTWLSMAVAHAITCGSDLLNWKTTKPAGVLYIDGELPLSLLKERLTKTTESIISDRKKPFMFLTPDCQKRGLPDLSAIEGQMQIEALLDDEIELVVLDNLSCLQRSGEENKAESWSQMQEWLLRLRSQGKSVLIVHHTGKSGKQRGTSKREDVLDTVIQLKPINEESEHLGASFEIHFEKTRGFFGDETLPIVANFSVDKNNHPQWSWGKNEESTLEKVLRMSDEGMTRKEIAKDLGISRQAVHQHLQKMK